MSSMSLRFVLVGSSAPSGGERLTCGAHSRARRHVGEMMRQHTLTRLCRMWLQRFSKFFSPLCLGSRGIFSLQVEDARL